MARRTLILMAVALGGACAKRQPAPRSPAAVVAPAPVAPEPPPVCYARGATAAAFAGDVEATSDPKRSVFVLDREMFPELARRLDHPSELQKKESLDRAIVHMVARRHVDEVTACGEALFAKATEKAPDQSGTVTARFLVAADGQVTRAQVTASTVNDAATEDCIGQSLCTWRFPPLVAGHGVAFEYSFVLAPR
ncbi:MAG TPA: AgmX/PglI C-terminal domain-containing protein [Polyangia bacterium]|nr:AgmX/PglI C-terminal domain-containing protein [Polyangia bacterium]